MRTAVWSIVVGGLMGALLWAGQAGAQGLPGCLTQLGVCTTSLGTCQKDLAVCEAEPTVIFPGDGSGHGPALSYTDNGNGTLTDNNTQLMWEKKEAGACCGGACLTDLHSVSAVCLWTQATGAWIAAINAANLGGHNDWRLPNIKELQSIVDYGKSNPAASVPGLTTAVGAYWSSTVQSTVPDAWVIGFVDGRIEGAPFEASLLSVRAVRDSQ